MSNPFANMATHLGKHVSVRVTGPAGVLEVFEAEKLTGKPILKVIDTEPLSKGFTQHETHSDGFEVDITGIKKSNKWLQEVKRQVKRNIATGKPFEKYTVLLKYTDINTNTVEQIKVVNATITEIEAFGGQGNLEKMGEGAKFIGDLG